MKTFFFFLLLFVFALAAVPAMHAQNVDPAVQAAMEAAVPAQYAGYTSLAIILLMMFGRWVKALQNGTGIRGWFTAIWMGTNTPRVLLGCLSLLFLPSCADFLKSPQGRELVVSLVDIGARGAVASGHLSEGDSILIGQGVGVLTGEGDVTSKVVKLSEIGLAGAADKGLIKPGDEVLIGEATAVIKQALLPVPLEILPAK